MTDIPADYCGWWRIIDAGTWVNDYLDDFMGCKSPVHFPERSHSENFKKY
jgi:hypothetical protein